MRRGTRDDRGATITALHPRSLRRTAAAPDARRADLARRLRHAIKAEARRWSWSNIAIAAGAAALWIGLQIVVYATGLSRFFGLRVAVFWGAGSSH